VNILLIESDRVLGDTYKTAMEEAGHTVIWKRTGQTALDVLDDRLPDVIVLELQLGLHGGIEFLYELRSHADWLKLPVIVHTINPQAVDSAFADAFVQLGVETILYKPNTSVTQLIRTIEHQTVHPA
jgi:two-component system, OmpR family, response regulator BaeR